MSWGVATQNGVSVSLASIVSLSAGVTEFSPIDLFTGGTVGAWYDPSDYSTLFQDSAGTTPVTAVEQPVGLMLDKSQGLVIGPELVTNGDFSNGSTGWTLGAGWTVTGGGLAINQAGSAVGASQTFSITAGKAYVFEFDVTSYTSGVLGFGTKTGAVVTFGQINAAGHVKAIGFAGASNDGIRFFSTASGFVGTIDNITVRELPGNHASQATSTSRPVLRARYNQLTYSEQFDNAAWTKTAATVTANAAVAPDGTATADLIVPDTANTAHFLAQNISGFPIGTATYSLRVKPSGYSWVTLFLYDGVFGNRFANFNLSGAGALGNSLGVSSRAITGPDAEGFYTVSATCTTAAAITIARIYVGNADTTGTNLPSFAGNGTDGIFIWGADLRTGSSAGTYQRIAAATDYATAGFLPYLAFDGSDDSFGTNSINFSATDKMSVCAGVTKLSDANIGMVTEFSTVAGTSSGAFALRAPYTAGTADYGFQSTGTTSVNITATSYVSPITNVVTGLGNISAPSATLRVNGAQVGQITSSQGTGNYGNYPLFIGRRNNASIPLNGRIYGLIVAGKTLSASELSATESWMAAKTGVTL